MWKRKNARLSFYWKCERFTEHEIDLPEYTRIKETRRKTKDQHTTLHKIYYKNEVTFKSFVSFLVFLGMVSALFLLERKYSLSFLNVNICKACIVVLDILVTILYRVWIKVKVLPNNDYAHIFVGEGRNLNFFVHNLLPFNCILFFRV